MSDSRAIDWMKNRYREKECVYMPRPTYAGRPLKPGAGDYKFRVLNLYAGWRMDGGDKYPGEYALMPRDGGPIFADMEDSYWIASGDVKAACQLKFKPNKRRLK